ncbi:globin-coupled sensor protein, partial [Azospirillum sp. A39]
EQQTAATQEIARNVQQAARGTQSVTDTVGHVNASASETGAIAENVLGAAAQLHRQADSLRSSVHTFLGSIRAA